MTDAVKVTAGASVGYYGKARLPAGTWTAICSCVDESGRSYPFTVTLANPVAIGNDRFSWDIALEASAVETASWAETGARMRIAQAHLKFTDASTPPVVFYRGPFPVEIRGAPF